MTPLVFVGTMWCGETDYDRCCDAILNQKNVLLRHSVIQNRPEKDAHNELWNEWRSVQSTFNMFVKVDADTVLAHDNVLFEFWKMMQDNPRITGIQAPLFDYFTDSYINGLNCFGQKVTFLGTRDQLYCDRHVDVDHDIVIKSHEVPEKLKPAGFHCHYASHEQAFHFGLHRALKNQTTTIQLVHSAWKRYRDANRAYALLGANLAPEFRTGEFNYTDDKFKSAFNDARCRYAELVSNLL